jgi:aminoglycoside 3'-phosphotransferase-2
MHAPPPELAALLRRRAAQPITTGESGARVLRYTRAGAPTLFLKTIAADGRALGDEAARLRWMAARGVPVPEVLHYAVHADREYLLLTEVPGVDASVVAAEVAPAGDAHAVGAAAAVVCALADALRRLHATKATDCPFRHPATARVAEARARAHRGLVDESDFDEERRGRRADELVTELEALAPRGETAVLTHGDYCLPNVMLRVGARHAAGAQGGGGAQVVVSGFVDCGRAGLADPYQDLALAARSIACNIGPRWVPEFFSRYGTNVVDERKLRFYTLLDEFF